MKLMKAFHVWQVDASVGATILCSCVCPSDSTNLKCQDPNQVPIKKQYEFYLDVIGQVVLKVTDGSNITYRLVKTMSNLPSEPTESQFIGTSSSGFTGVLDAPDTYYEQLGLVPCIINSTGACEVNASASFRRSTQSVVDECDLIDVSNKTYPLRCLAAGSVAFHTIRRGHGRALISTVANSLSTDAFKLLGTLDDSAVSGVQSPLICLKAGQGVIWSVSSSAGKSHYPQYVPNSLFNTNPNFDYGSLLNLGKDVEAGRPVSSYYQAFSTAGIYVFRDGGDNSKQTVIGVVDPLVDCPLAFEKNPIQVLSSDILQDFPSGKNPVIIAPDYALIAGIGGAMGVILVFSLCCLYLRRVVGWGQLRTQTRSYREKQLKGKEDLHSMASKRQTSRRADSVSGKVLDDLDDQAAGYVDLEGFNVQTLFDKLQDQTNLVTEQLTKQKDDVKEFYEKVERTLNGKLGDLTIDEISVEEKRAQRRQMRIDSEILRRKRIGSDSLALMSKHRTARNAEALITEQMQQDVIDFDRKLALFTSKMFSHDAAPTISSLRIEELELQNELSESIEKYRKVVMITPGIGAKLLDPELVEIDRVTKLCVPCRGARMQIGNEESPVVVPSNCFIHPETGQVMPMEGNIWYDVLSGSFSVGSRLSFDAMRAGPLPYICNVSGTSNCYPSSSAPYAHLLPSENWWPLKDDREMYDSFTGIKVPVVGVTFDPRCGNLTAVGGIMVDAETRMLKPIRMYEVFEDPKSRKLGFVLGVTIDPLSLKAVPIFGRCVYT
jgi:hypothetical protein